MWFNSHAVLLVANGDDLLGRPWVGASWEGFVIEQVIGLLLQSGRAFEPYYFRTSDGYEVDLVLDLGRHLWAIEVKLTTHPAPADLNRLECASSCWTRTPPALPRPRSA